MAGAIALVDGYNLAFRAYYGMPELTRADGFPTGALHGWVKTLWWIEDHIKPERMVVFFDLGGAARQTALQADYKAHRSEMPEALERQVPEIKRLTRQLGYGGVELEGVEADDLIAGWALELGAAGREVIVVSADKDLGQLVGGTVRQLVPPPTANPRLGWRTLDAAGVREKFGVGPERIAAYLALVGDSADNIAGLRGVGPKTAVKWLQQYGTLEAVIAHCGELQPKRFQAMVHAEQARLRVNLEMTQLDAARGVDWALVAAAEPTAALALMEAMEMGKTAAQYRKRLAE